MITIQLNFNTHEPNLNRIGPGVSLAIWHPFSFGISVTFCWYRWVHPLSPHLSCTPHFFPITSYQLYGTIIWIISLCLAPNAALKIIIISVHCAYVFNLKLLSRTNMSYVSRFLQSSLKCKINGGELEVILILVSNSAVNSICLHLWFLLLFSIFRGLWNTFSPKSCSPWIAWILLCWFKQRNFFIRIGGP